MFGVCSYVKKLLHCSDVNLENYVKKDLKRNQQLLLLKEKIYTYK